MSRTTWLGLALLICTLVFLMISPFQARPINPKAYKGDASVTEDAILAGGCFWCVHADIKKIDHGIIQITSGYTGGTLKNPTYEDVLTEKTGHYEAVKVTFDPTLITYADVLEYFFKHIDPTDAEGQFADRGASYRTAVFYLSEKQKKTAEEVKSRIDAAGIFKSPIATQILPASEFYPAEDYHQDYAEKNPLRYSLYREGSGRSSYLEKTWDGKVIPTATQKVEKPPLEVLKKKLTPIQYKVTQEQGTEQPFANEYWDNHQEGIYVDIVSGEVLFSSKDKYDSGTGWPSFTRPLVPANIKTEADPGLLMTRTEVRSSLADSHLGHVFEDGPAEAGGLRYCMNSASMRFVPVAELAKEGYGEYANQFKMKNE